MAGAEKPRSGRTYTVEEGVGARPRLPHEHDESSSSQGVVEPRRKMQQAHEDVASGIVDTDKGKPSHDAYQRQKTAPDTPPPDKA